MMPAGCYLTVDLEDYKQTTTLEMGVPQITRRIWYPTWPRTATKSAATPIFMKISTTSMPPDSLAS